MAAMALVMAPLSTTMPGEGLDPSWGLVIERAVLEGWQWGRDIVFTFGPYGHHYQRLFHPDLIGGVLATSVIRSVLLGLGVLLLTRAAPPWRAGLGVAAVAISQPVTGDTAYFLLPLMAALAQVHDGGRAALAYGLAVAAFCGLAALIKTTFAVLALALFLLVDLDRLCGRRAPLFTPVCLAVAATAYLAAGQSPAGLADFIRLSLDIAAGFSQAMGVFDALRAVELAAFLLASTVVLALVVTIERRGHRLATRTGVLMLLCLAAFWFVTYKAGFTRHDLHTLSAWASLGSAAALYAVSADTRAAPRAATLLLLAAVAIAAMTPLRLALAPGFALDRVLLQTLIYNPRDTLREVGLILADSADWKAGKQDGRDAALAAIRDRNPLPRMVGTIDTIPSVQAAVIAHALDGGAAYRPRPVFQEYSTYTAALIAANQASFAEAGAPDTVLFAPGSIDNRYPSLAEGPLWSLLLRHYAPSGRAGPLHHLNDEIDVLVLRRRAVSLAPPDPPTRAYGVAPGETLPLHEFQGPVFATIDLRRTAVGRLLTLIHQTPTVDLAVTFGDGSVRTHRLIPAIARAGFLLSPYVSDASDAEMLFAGETAGPARTVTGLRVDIPSLAGWAFDDRIDVRLIPLR